MPLKMNLNPLNHKVVEFRFCLQFTLQIIFYKDKLNNSIRLELNKIFTLTGEEMNEEICVYIWTSVKVIIKYYLQGDNHPLQQTVSMIRKRKKKRKKKSLFHFFIHLFYFLFFFFLVALIISQCYSPQDEYYIIPEICAGYSKSGSVNATIYKPWKCLISYQVNVRLK